MPLWGVTDSGANKPTYLTTAEKTGCLGADAVETAVQSSSGLVGHQGWTVAAGGNDNTAAQRETLVCVHITGDDSDDATLPDSA
jgi:hypothetical protein